MSSNPGPELAPPDSGRRPWSLAARLTAWYAGAAFALVLAATGFLYWALAASLDREDDEFLADEVGAVRAVLRDRPGDPAALRREAEGVATHQEGRVYVRVLDGAGDTLAETP